PDHFSDRTKSRHLCGQASRAMLRYRAPAPRSSGDDFFDALLGADRRVEPRPLTRFHRPADFAQDSHVLRLAEPQNTGERFHVGLIAGVESIVLIELVQLDRIALAFGLVGEC